MRYSIVVRNHGERPVNVTIARKGIGGPSSAYPAVGQSALERFWNRLYDERRVVGPGEQAHLDPDLVYLAAPDGSLVHAIYDIETDGPLEIAFVADDDFFRFLEPYLDLYEDMVRPVGERMRGTFPTSERYISLRVGDTPVSFSFAGNQPPDLYLWGTDGVDGSPRQNYGNYGVTYHIDVLMEVTEPRRIRLYLGPEYTNAGTCVLAPALLLTDGAHDDDAESGRVVRLPASSRAVDARFIGETVVLSGEPRGAIRFHAARRIVLAGLASPTCRRSARRKPKRGMPSTGTDGCRQYKSAWIRSQGRVHALFFWRRRWIRTHVTLLGWHDFSTVCSRSERV